MKRRAEPETSVARYDWTRARRGHWAGRLRTAKAVLVQPEIYEQFGSDAAVNAALAAVVRLRDAIAPGGKRRRRAA
jgi:hypothetical protein